MQEKDYILAVDRNRQRLFLIAFSYVKNVDDANDILQNTFLKLWKFSGEFNDEKHIDKWLARVCINECKDQHKLLRRRDLPLDNAINIAKDDEHFDTDLFKAIMSLPKKERLILHLFYYEDMSIKDISKLLKIKESTIKSMLRRSRQKLKIMLGDEYINE